MDETRTGMPIYFTKKGIRKLNRRIVKSHVPKDRGQEDLVLEKIQRVVNAECLKDLHVCWNIRFFGLKKGETDMSIVHHG